MTSDAVHPESEIQELLDGRLSPDRRAEVERHLAGCAECRRLREALALVRESVRTALPAPRVPGEVVAGVAAAIDREARRAAAPQSTGPAVAPRRFGRVALLAGLAAAALAALVLLSIRAPSLPTAVLEDYARFRTGKLPLELQTDNPQQMESFFAERRIPFRTRVFDLGMMGYRLVGGRSHTLARRRSALFVYRGPGNKILVCQMYEGDTRELPRNAQIRRHGDFTFHVYRRKGQTLVFWQEGRVTCVLTSDIDPEEVIQLAFAKAMKA